MMGKKKKKGVKKTKEEVLLAETPSSTTTTTTEAQTPRKRGRPRKIIITDEKDEEQIAQIDQFQDFACPNFNKAAKPSDDGEEGDSKEKRIDEMVGPSSKSDKHENFKLEDKVSTKQKQFALRRSRTRRKSKPTKSS